MTSSVVKAGPRSRSSSPSSSKSSGCVDARLVVTAVALIDVDARGDQEGHDLPVGPLLDVVRAARAREAVATLVPVARDRQVDRLGAHVHLAAARAGRPDGGHLTPKHRSDLGVALRGSDVGFAGLFRAYAARVRRSMSRRRSRELRGSEHDSASGPRRSSRAATHPRSRVGSVPSTPPSSRSSTARGRVVLRDPAAGRPQRQPDDDVVRARGRVQGSARPLQTPGLEPIARRTRPARSGPRARGARPSAPTSHATTYQLPSSANTASGSIVPLGPLARRGGDVGDRAGARGRPPPLRPSSSRGGATAPLTASIGDLAEGGVELRDRRREVGGLRDARAWPSARPPARRTAVASWRVSRNGRAKWSAIVIQISSSSSMSTSMRSPGPYGGNPDIISRRRSRRSCSAGTSNSADGLGHRRPGMPHEVRHDDEHAPQPLRGRRDHAATFRHRRPRRVPQAVPDAGPQARRPEDLRVGTELQEQGRHRLLVRHRERQDDATVRPPRSQPLPAGEPRPGERGGGVLEGHLGAILRIRLPGPSLDVLGRLEPGGRRRPSPASATPVVHRESRNARISSCSRSAPTRYQWPRRKTTP